MPVEILFAAHIVLVQAIAAWIRYLPFRAELKRSEIRLLFRRMLIWSAAAFLMLDFIFETRGVNMSLYKLILIVGWLPYFLISLTIIRHRFKQHVFVLGIQHLWIIMLHTLTTFADEILCRQFLLDAVMVHGSFYTAILIATLPLTRQLFLHVLPPTFLFEGSFGRLGATLPFVFYIATMLPLSNHWNENIDMMFQPLEARFLRFLLPLFFVMMYRTIGISMRQLEERRQQQNLNEILNRQLDTLKRHNQLIQANQERLTVFRHDLRHNYRLLNAMIDEGKIRAAIEFLNTQDRLLDKTDRED